MWSWFRKLLEISIQEHFFPVYVYQSFYFLLRIIYIIQRFQVQKNMTLKSHGFWKSFRKEKEMKWTSNQADFASLLPSLLFEKQALCLFFSVTTLPSPSNLLIFHILWFFSHKFTHDRDTGWKTTVLIYYVLNTAWEVIKNTPHTNIYVSLHIYEGGGRRREREETIVDLGIDCPSDESRTLMKIILLSYVYTTLDST